MKHPFAETNVVLLCCQGRAGSTLLLRILNSIEGYDIVESKGASLDLIRLYGNIKFTEGARTNHPEEHMQLAWKNNFNYENMVNGIYNLFYELFGNEKCRVTGLKETRFGYENTYEEFEERLNLFRELFPKLKVIFLTRNIEELLVSRWWAKNKEQSRIILTNQENYFERYFERALLGGSDWLYFLKYSDLCQKTNALIELFNFLGEEFSEEKYLKEIEKKTT